MNHMKEALMRRKHAGVDITLVLKHPEDDQKGDNRELAPDVKDTLKGHDLPMDQSSMEPPGMKPEVPQHPDESQDRDLIQKMLDAHELNEGDDQLKGPPSIKSRAHALMKEKLKK